MPNKYLPTSLLKVELSSVTTAEFFPTEPNSSLTMVKL